MLVQFAKQHRVLSAAVIPVVFYLTYLIALIGASGFRDICDGYILTIIVDVVVGALALLYCRQIYLHVPCVRSIPRAFKVPVISIVILVALFILLIGQSMANYVLRCGVDNWGSYVQTKQESPFIYIVVLQVLVAPVVEEILFRMCLYGSFSRVMPPVVAALISSSLFAIGHSTVAQWAATFLIGLFNCLLYARFGRVWVVIGVHMISNTFATFLSGLPVPNIFFNDIFVLVVYTLCVVMCCIGLTQQFRCCVGTCLKTKCEDFVRLSD